MNRLKAPGAERALGKKIRVGRGGFVRLVDYLGGDLSVVRAARVTTGSRSKGEARDRKLIRYLMRNRHTSPFEFCEAVFHVRCPMDVWRQWIRHRTASVNEYSTRYREAIDEAGIPSRLRLQAQEGNRQGSAGLLDQKEAARQERAIEEAVAFARATYEDLLRAGVAREQARTVLPLATYTEAYWKIDLHNLLHFLRLRLHPHAQQEIREFAEAIASIVARWVPWTWEAFSEKA